VWGRIEEGKEGGNSGVGGLEGVEKCIDERKER